MISSFFGSLRRLPFLLLARDVIFVFGTFGILIAFVEFSQALAWLADILGTQEALATMTLIAFAYGFYWNWPPSYYCFKINNRDASVELRIGNLFKHNGPLIIPVNSSFDMSLNGSVGASNSTQALAIKKFFRGDSAGLNTKVQARLQTDIYNTQREGDSYKVGTTVLIPTGDREGECLYFVANSHTNRNGTRVETKEQELPDTLAGLWSFITEHGSKANLAMPLIGTGRGRTTTPREQVYKEIVKSFVGSCSDKVLCNKLTIYIRAQDVADHKIKLEDLVEYTKYQTVFAEFLPRGDLRATAPSTGTQ